jgi:hypothetical protein
LELNSIRLLMNSVIDYAGLFPPAGLEMTEALRDYARFRTGKQNWMLGRFIVPVLRLAELESHVDEFKQLHLSALGSADPESDFEQIATFNRRQASFVIDSLEIKAQSAEEIDRAMQIFADRLRTIFEIPIGENTRPLLAAIARSGGQAKVRTGGVRPELFPSPAQLAGFILDCAATRVPFKATAGLHHALRAVYPFTYEPSSPSGVMHGFGTVLVAAAFAYAGADVGTIEAILEEQTIESFNLNEKGISWRSGRLDTNTLGEMRERLFISFGSCSFEEPVAELKALKMI